jgi:hypothetical protein
MRIVTRSLLLFALLALMACATPRHTQQVPCNAVRCAGCPEGQTPALEPPSCCKCVPIDTTITDCSNVRCAACPPGQTPSLQPPDCCKCVASQ